MIPFTKMHGLGNDYIFLDAFGDARLASMGDYPALAAAMSDRRRGAGADGLILLEPADDAEARMRIWNADGSDGVICGNGLRCAARLLIERGHAPGDSLRIRTGAGVRGARAEREGGVFAAEIDMGTPTLDVAALPVRVADLDSDAQRGGESCTSQSLGAGILCVYAMGGRRGVFVGVGNPHFVTVVEEDPGEATVEREGPALERHPAFPERMNIQFAQVLSRRRLRLRTWERGSGATLACGTGACAAVVGLAALGLLDREAIVTLPGGDLRVRWDASTDRVSQTGPAAFVYDGAWPEPGERA